MRASRCAAGRGLAGLKRQSGGLEIASSNLAVPTISRTRYRNVGTRRYCTDMADLISQKPAWSDDQLPAAVAAARSWRGVMRELGLNPSNGGATLTVRRHAARLGLDTSHFKGNRSWSDAVLRQAITDSRTWEDVLVALGLSSRAGGERTLVKAHALRLGLDFSHLGRPALHAAAPCELRPDLAHLRQAAESLAATWFVLCGCNVAYPAVPDCYDLLVSASDGMKRVQVKTTTCVGKHGWQAQVSRRPYSVGNNAPLIPYDPEVIDLFFVVDGDLTIYVIPSLAVGGRSKILLRSYTKYIVGNAAGLMVSRRCVA
jgi:hypothetical protein